MAAALYPNGDHGIQSDQPILHVGHCRVIHRNSLSALEINEAVQSAFYEKMNEATRLEMV